MTTAAGPAREDGPVQLDQRTLNLAAAGLSCLASIAALLGRRRDGLATVSGLIGLIGGAAWAMAAFQDLQDDRAAA